MNDAEAVVSTAINEALQELCAPVSDRSRPSFRYGLPQRLRDVKVTAFADALELAYTSIWLGLAQDAQELPMLAVGACEGALERMSSDGRRGSNIPALFRTVYVKVFMLAYPRAYAALESGQYAIAPGLPAYERWSQFYDYASARIDR